MKLNIKIDTNVEEPEALITTARMTEEVNRVADFISGLDNAATVILGMKDGKTELLEQNALVRIYTENGKVFAKTDCDLYQVRLRLYELEERLDNRFVRISNSEIVNLKKVKSLGGALGGIVISYFIEIGVSIAIGDGNFYPCVPGLTERYGSEITAVIIQTLLSVLLGMGFAGASYIWDRDDWSLLKQTGIYFAVVTILMMTISYVCEWMEHSVKGFVSYFAIFLAIFVAVWIIRYSFWKLRIAKIKGKILENKQK